MGPGPSGPARPARAGTDPARWARPGPLEGSRAAVRAVRACALGKDATIIAYDSVLRVDSCVVDGDNVLVLGDGNVVNQHTNRMSHVSF